MPFMFVALKKMKKKKKAAQQSITIRINAGTMDDHCYCYYERKIEKAPQCNILVLLLHYYTVLL